MRKQYTKTQQLYIDSVNGESHSSAVLLIGKTEELLAKVTAEKDHLAALVERLRAGIECLREFANTTHGYYDGHDRTIENRLLAMAGYVTGRYDGVDAALAVAREAAEQTRKENEP